MPDASGNYEPPQTGTMPQRGKSVVAEVYNKCRKDGGDKEKCAKIAWSAARKAGYEGEYAKKSKMGGNPLLSKLAKMWKMKKEDISIDVTDMPLGQAHKKMEDMERMGYQVQLDSEGGRKILKCRKSNLRKTGIASLPADQKKSIDTKLHSMPPKMVKTAVKEKYKGFEIMVDEGPFDVEYFMLDAGFGQAGPWRGGVREAKNFIDTGMADKYKRPMDKAKLAKAWGALRKAEEDAEYEKECKEHPDLSPEIIRQIVEDHKSARMAKAKLSIASQSRWEECGKEPEEVHVQHGLGAREFAVMEACFLKPGEYHDNAGNKHRYDWPAIERAAGTFKGRKFYLEHKEGIGYEYGLVEDVEARQIDGEDWLVAKVKVPEVEFTQDLLARIEAGLAGSVSTTHFLLADQESGEVRRIRGRALSLVEQGEIPGARILNIQRHVKAG